MTRSLLVYGSGGHGKVVADAAVCAGWQVRGFADDDAGRAHAQIFGLPVLAVGRDAAVRLCLERETHAVIAVGDNRARMGMYQALAQAGVRMATIIHSAAVIAASADVGPGTVVLANAVVGPDSRIGENVILNTAAAVDHDCVVGDHVHLAPGARTGGTVSIGPGTMLGIGASARNNITIGAWSMVGMGAVVTRDVPDGVTVYGNPARIQPRGHD